MMKKLILVSALLGSMLIAGAAELIHLKMDFSRPGWNEILSPQGGETTVRDGELSLSAGSSVVTPYFPLTPGELEVRGIAAGNLTLRIHFLRGGNHRDPGTEVGIRSVQTEKDGNFLFRIPVADSPAGSDGFRLEISGAPGKKARLRALEIKLAAGDGITINGDPFFQNELGRDHWLVESGKSRILSDTGHFRGKLLEMTDAGTVVSPRFAYRGEQLTIGLWGMQENLHKGAGQPEWAYACVQILLFDRKGKEISHIDLTPIQAGALPWKYYCRTFEPDSWPRNTESFAIASRIFPGATGTVRLGAVSVIRRGEAAVRPPYRAEEGKIRIGTGKPGEVFSPIWQCADMSFAGDAAQKPMRHALRELRRIGVRHLRLREFMQGQRLVKSIAPDGSFELDYSLLDKTFDYVVRELGYQLTVTVETTPNQLSVMPGPDDYAYAHPYPPRDLKIWGNILQAVVGHWIDRYGKACVAEWTFECWNEPNASYFFKGTEAEFAEIFGAYLDALTEIERKHDIRLQIGTMSAAGVTPWFFSCLEKARAIGKLDAIDALSLHLYAGFIGSMGTFAGDVGRMRRIASEYPPMENRPIYITEYNASTMSDSRLDTVTNAAFFVKANRIFLDEKVARAYFFAVCDHLWTGNNHHFEGGLGLFTKTAIPKPVLNALTLLNRFEGCRRLPVNSSNDPFDAIAGIDETGTVRVLLTTFDERRPEETAAARLRLEFDWTGRSRNIVPRLIRVDSRHANSHAAYREAGSPTITAHPDVTPFRQAGEMKSEPVTKFRFSGDKLLIDLEPELNSVTCVEIAPAERL